MNHIESDVNKTVHVTCDNSEQGNIREDFNLTEHTQAGSVLEAGVQKEGLSLGPKPSTDIVKNNSDALRLDNSRSKKDNNQIATIASKESQKSIRVQRDSVLAIGLNFSQDKNTDNFRQTGSLQDCLCNEQKNCHFELENHVQNYDNFDVSTDLEQTEENNPEQNATSVSLIENNKNCSLNFPSQLSNESISNVFETSASSLALNFSHDEIAGKLNSWQYKNASRETDALFSKYNRYSNNDMEWNVGDVISDFPEIDRQSTHFIGTSQYSNAEDVEVYQETNFNIQKQSSNLNISVTPEFSGSGNYSQELRTDVLEQLKLLHSDEGISESDILNSNSPFHVNYGAQRDLEDVVAVTNEIEDNNPTSKIAPGNSYKEITKQPVQRNSFFQIPSNFDFESCKTSLKSSSNNGLRQANIDHQQLKEKNCDHKTTSRIENSGLNRKKPSDFQNKSLFSSPVNNFDSSLCQLDSTTNHFEEKKINHRNQTSCEKGETDNKESNSINVNESKFEKIESNVHEDVGITNTEIVENLTKRVDENLSQSKKSYKSKDIKSDKQVKIFSTNRGVRKTRRDNKSGDETTGRSKDTQDRLSRERSPNLETKSSPQKVSVKYNTKDKSACETQKDNNEEVKSSCTSEHNTDRSVDNTLRHCYRITDANNLPQSSSIGTEIGESQNFCIHEHKVKSDNLSLSNGGICEYGEIHHKCYPSDPEVKEVCNLSEHIKTHHSPNGEKRHTTENPLYNNSLR